MCSLLFYKVFILDVRFFYTTNANYAYKVQSFEKVYAFKRLRLHFQQNAKCISLNIRLNRNVKHAKLSNIFQPKN